MRNLISMADLPDVIRTSHRIQIDTPEEGQPLYVRGPIGVGKSQCPKQVAEEDGTYCKIVNLADYQPSEISGWVTQVGDQMAQLKPSWFVDILREADKGRASILVLEEFGLCDQDQQRAAAKIVCDRTVAGEQLPPNCLIVANGNRREDRVGIRAMPEHLVSRFSHVDVEAELEPTLAHFAKIGVDPIVSGYLAFSKDSLHRHQPDGTPFPSPRSWVAVSRILKAGASKTIESVLIAGRIGVEEAAKFIGFQNLAHSLTVPSKVFASPDTAPVPTTDDGDPAMDGCFAMVSALVAAVSTKTASALGVYLKRLPVELHPVAGAALKLRNEGLKAEGKPQIKSAEIADIYVGTQQVLAEDD